MPRRAISYIGILHLILPQERSNGYLYEATQINKYMSKRPFQLLANEVYFLTISEQSHLPTIAHGCHQP